jgi:hypothetical protein
LPARCIVRKQQKPRPVMAIISFFPTEAPRVFVSQFISSSNIFDEFVKG